ncbi:MAG: NUDIX hydrolase, partial [Nitrosopumilus sp.]|nr:NUDIX hydrolase [Nitrosopumilus sp.]
TLEKREEPIKCAFRELEEETGYRAKRMTPLITYYPSIGYNAEIIHCFLASGLKKIYDLKLDEDEILSVVKMDLKKVLSMIKTGKIQDSKTICAVLTYVAKKKLY